MRHTGNWTDIYGAVHASFDGRSGGHRWLVALPAAQAEAPLDGQVEAQASALAQVQAGLEALDAKGRADLLVFADVQAVPAAARELGARGVLLIGAEAEADAWGLPAETIPSEVRRCTADEVRTALEEWLGSVPHGR